MDPLDEYRQILLARYAAVGDELDQSLAQIPAKAQHTPLDWTGWSVHQIIAHLRDSEAQAYWPRLERTLNENMPVLDRFDGTTWMQEHYRPDEPTSAILADYRALREKELARLSSLQPGAWCRQARHPGWGVRTLQWLVEHSLAYTEMHLKQIKRYLSKNNSWQ
ncbi:MAG TPA: DinB family protein [Anaerolineales bacterium]